VKAEGARLSASVGGDVSVAGAARVADCAGALYWPEEGLLAVADLHLEKGSSFATRGVLLPPYDTAATLAKLGALVARYAPRFVVALGDSFHDGDGPQRVSEDDRAMIGALQRGRDWIWIAGNHDPEPVRDLGGVSAAMFAIGPLVFRHAPEREEADGEIAGHLHPVARVNGRGRTVMPAFGAYTGGLNIRSAAFADVFGTFKFMAHMLGDARIYAISAQRCRGD
jgi:DNA ligase-associated metallophosphoesterase